MERSYVMIKPGFTHLEKEILKMLEIKNSKIIARKELALTKELLKEHYRHIADKDFYPEVEAYMLSAPVIAYVFEGEDGLISKIREIVGPTKAAILKNENPELRNTIRGKYAIDGSKNVIHASDSIDTANEEITRFFGKDYSMQM